MGWNIYAMNEIIKDAAYYKTPENLAKIKYMDLSYSKSNDQQINKLRKDICLMEKKQLQKHPFYKILLNWYRIAIEGRRECITDRYNSEYIRDPMRGNRIQNKSISKKVLDIMRKYYLID